MNRNMNKLFSILGVILGSSALIVYLNVKYKTNYPTYLYVVFTISLLFVYSKITISFLHSKKVDRILKEFNVENANGKVSIIIPCYNESHEIVVKLFEQLKQQTLRAYEVIFIDDCSTTLTNYNYVNSLRDTTDHNIIIKRFEKNKGKLAAVKWGIEQSRGDYIMLIDADSYIVETGIQEMLSPMYHHESISATCGQVLPLNRSKNFLTRMQDTLYFNAYNLGRHYQSYFSKVLVCSGAISMYRKKMIEPYLSELTTTLKGRKRLSGDDIVLTNIILKNGGRSVYVESVACYTAVPENIKDFFNQQLRWAKDAFFNMFEQYKTAISHPFYFLLQFQEVMFWLVSLISFLYFMVSRNILIDNKTMVLIGIFIITISFVENYYIISTKRETTLRAILYYNVYQFILIPIRVIALFTFLNQNWKRHSDQIHDVG
ncbi:glycosyltransferase family 2 protein [Erysipelothrix sp. HDW6C]|uniref:glycosyltransferase family 2 protein n=1 Tax=Erysipelothrix sp. HDW6C TaxID=2714930 RepID=UPI00140E9618|nr:glycosyltransferase [Erysipelothrix sp. HDW6C]QIK70689.1 glycosyltransferase family 2 protein [Erysipelothrix sp. HDW6C]